MVGIASSDHLSLDASKFYRVFKKNFFEKSCYQRDSLDIVLFMTSDDDIQSDMESGSDFEFQCKAFISSDKSSDGKKTRFRIPGDIQ